MKDRSSRSTLSLKHLASHFRFTAT